MALRDALNKLTGRPNPAAEVPPELQARIDAAAAEVERLAAEYGESALAAEDGDQLAAGRVVKAGKALEAARQHHDSLKAASTARQARERARAAADAKAAVKADDEARTAAHARMLAATEAADVAMTAAVQAMAAAADAMREYAAATGNATEVVSCIGQTCASFMPIIQFRMVDAGVPGTHRPAMLLREHTEIAGRLPRLILSTTLRRSA